VLDYPVEQHVANDGAFEKKRFEDLAGLNLKADHENTTIVMEILKYCGKDINLVEAFELFT